MELEFNIASWAAWCPSHQTKDDWKKNSEQTISEEVDSNLAPKLAQVPAMQRRRYSRLTKIMLEVAFQCQFSPDTRTIFCSRHGELNRTVTLLEDILNKHALSPMGFSQSVHNTASGIWGIVSNNKVSTTSIAAGKETFSQALIEAYTQLQEDPAPVFIVFADDPVPPIYDEYTDEMELPLGIGFLLTRRETKISNSAHLSINSQVDKDVLHIGYQKLLNALANHSSISGVISGWHWSLGYDN